MNTTPQTKTGNAMNTSEEHKVMSSGGMFNPRAYLLSLLAVLCLVAVPASASANFSLTDFGGSMSGPDGQRDLRAGGHPNFTTEFNFSWHVGPNGFAAPDANPKDVSVRLPAGLIGNPSGVPTCPIEKLSPGPGVAFCHPDSQVGNVEVKLARDGAEPDLVGDATDTFPIGIYNVDPPRGVVARFGFNVLATIVMLDAKVSADGEYHVEVTTLNTSRGLAVIGARTTFWGVPSDPSNDPQRVGFVDGGGILIRSSTTFPRRPFLTTPTRCTGEPLQTTLSVNSWEFPDEMLTSSFDRDFNGDPLTIEGCENLAFDPAISFDPTSKRADSPTGLNVELNVPQTDDPDAASTAHLRDVTVTLPEGLTINPSSADGLQACSDAQLGLGSDAQPTCPDGSKVGSVLATTPVLENPLVGSVFVRSQASNDPESGQMFRLAMVIDDEDRGVVVKLPGELHVDPATGRITAAFRNNPELPVSKFELSFKSGPRASLATPASCGAKTASTRLLSWGGQRVDLTDSFSIDCPGASGFTPTLVAGSTNPVGGAFSPLTVQLARPDGQQYLSGVSVDMPEGVLAKLAGVGLCPAEVAGDGTPGVCPAGSRVGSVTVGAGAGDPFFLKGDAYLTGPYKGAPYGLSIQVPAKAGPFDLGMVKVRQALHIDPDTAAVTVVSDPLPQVVKGVPVRMRDASVDIDRPNFTINPTSCAAKQIAATLTSADGAVHKTSTRFRASDCRALGFKPRLAMRLSGKRQTRTGGHPALRSVLTQGKGQAGIGSAKVTLPKSVALDAVNSADRKLVCDYDRSLKADCPASSVIGNATAVTPLLAKPLSGKVHLVQGIKFGPKGNRIRTYPTLLVKLRGDVAIDLRAKTNVSKTNRLETVFPTVPDAPVSKFTLNINGGKKGILVVTRTRKSNINLCNAKQTAQIETDAHNGKRADFATNIKTPCAMKAAKSKKSRKK